MRSHLSGVSVAVLSSEGKPLPAPLAAPSAASFAMHEPPTLPPLQALGAQINRKRFKVTMKSTGTATDHHHEVTGQGQATRPNSHCMLRENLQQSVFSYRL